jgi:ABC-type transport system involved in multi-copper enzyme maturation permease subunit
MTPALPALQDFSDRLSPMVVKEMRQGLRTRFFTGTLILFHVILGLLMLSHLLHANTHETTEMFWSIILLTLLGILPLRAFNALHSEMKDGTLDMLTLTGITSFRLVWGKWASLYSQSLLLASSLLPYMIVRYVFGGVEIAREALALLITVAGSGLITAAVTGFSSQKLLLARGLMVAATMVPACLIGMFAYALSCEEYTSQRMMTTLAHMGPVKGMLFCLGIAALAACLGYQFLCLGSARLPFVADSQRAIKRIVISVVLGLLVTAALTIAFLRLDWHYVIALTYLPTLMILVLFSMDLVTEELPSGPGAAEHWFRRSGWPSGILFISVLWLAPLVILLAYEYAVAGKSQSWRMEVWFVALGIMASALAPVGVPLFRRHSRLAQWWVVQILMGAVCVAYAIAMEVLPYDDREPYAFMGLATPASTLIASAAAPHHTHDTIHKLGFFTHGAWIMLAIILAARTLIQKRRETLKEVRS